MNSYDEFLKALSMIEPVAPLDLEYRLHYNDQGDITLCTMQKHPENTQYIVVTKEEYDNYYRYCVVDKKLKLIDNGPVYRVKLLKSNSGFCVVKDHASILLEPGESYSNIEFYDATN